MGGYPQGARGQSRLHIKGVRAPGVTDFECSWRFDVDRRSELNPLGLSRKPTILACLLKSCPHQPSQTTITAAGSDFVALVVKNSKPSPPTITAGGSGFVVFVVTSPRLPLSQREAQTLSSLSSKLSPKWQGAQHTEINPVGLIPNGSSTDIRFPGYTFPPKPNKPQGPQKEILHKELIKMKCEA